MHRAMDRWRSEKARNSESLPFDSSAERRHDPKDSSCVQRGAIAILMTKERRPAFRTIEGWARSVLMEAGAIHECEEHGWTKDRADPHACARALLVARQDPPPGVSPDRAVAAVRDMLDTIGDICPECPPDSGWKPSAALPRTHYADFLCGFDAGFFAPSLDAFLPSIGISISF